MLHNVPEKDTMSKHTKSRTHRGGKYKCKRCKEVFTKIAGDSATICDRCRNHCVRCDTLLTDETASECSVNRKRYYCKQCIVETTTLTRDKLKQRDYELNRNYGITQNEYEQLLAAKNAVCWICSRPPTNTRLHVDHKHEKGEKKRNPREKRVRVRGLLCWQCNGAIGKFKDNPELMRKAADYIESKLAQQVLNKEL